MRALLDSTPEGSCDYVKADLVTCSRWRPDPESDEPEVYLFGGVARIG